MKLNRKHKFRILAAVLTAILTLGIFAGCGAQKDAQTDTQAPATQPAAENGTQPDSTQPAAEEVNDQLAAIQKAGKIVVGLEGAYPPFNYHDDSDELVGFDVEVAKAVAEKLGVTVEFVEAPWDSLLAGVDSGRFDTVINCVSISEERKEKYDFSEPYVYSPTQILVRTGNDTIKTVDDLKGKKLAGNSTNVLAPWFESLGVELVPIDTASEAINLLLADRVDFLSFSGITFSSYLDEHPDTDIKVAFPVPNAEQQVGIPIRKGETRLLNAVNEAVSELRESGKLAAISEEYLKDDFTVPATK